MTDPNHGQPLPARQQIERLHGLYCRLSGQQIRLDMAREGIWFEFIRRGFTGEDLQLVLRALRAAIARGDRNPGALKFSNLVGQPDYFEEDLALIRAHARPKPATEKTQRHGDTEKIVEDAGGGPPAKTAADVLNCPAFKELLALREKL